MAIAEVRRDTNTATSAGTDVVASSAPVKGYSFSPEILSMYRTALPCLTIG